MAHAGTNLKMYQGDLEPDLLIKLSGEIPVDLTLADEVHVKGIRNYQEIFNRVPTEITSDGESSLVTLEWIDGDTDTLGPIIIEIDVEWPLGRMQTFRPTGFVEIVR